MLANKLILSQKFTEDEKEMVKQVNRLRLKSEQAQFCIKSCITDLNQPTNNDKIMQKMTEEETNCITNCSYKMFTS